MDYLKKITAQRFHFSDASKADKFYRFAAQSHVEFGLIGIKGLKSGKNETVVMTDQKLTSVGVPGYIDSVLSKNPNSVITRVSHSHPSFAGSPYPSGFNPNLTPDPTFDGDRDRHIEMQQHRGRVSAFSEMYYEATNTEIKYNGKKATEIDD